MICHHVGCRAEIRVSGVVAWHASLGEIDRGANRTICGRTAQRRRDDQDTPPRGSVAPRIARTKSSVVCSPVLDLLPARPAFRAFRRVPSARRGDSAVSHRLRSTHVIGPKDHRSARSRSDRHSSAHPDAQEAIAACQLTTIVCSVKIRSVLRQRRREVLESTLDRERVGHDRADRSWAPSDRDGDRRSVEIRILLRSSPQPRERTPY
jgi:hypothetical protein